MLLKRRSMIYREPFSVLVSPNDTTLRNSNYDGAVKNSQIKTK